jgi:hypothetical protein
VPNFGSYGFRAVLRLFGAPPSASPSSATPGSEASPVLRGLAAAPALASAGAAATTPRPPRPRPLPLPLPLPLPPDLWTQRCVKSWEVNRQDAVPPFFGNASRRHPGACAAVGAGIIVLGGRTIDQEKQVVGWLAAGHFMPHRKRRAREGHH